MCAVGGAAKSYALVALLVLLAVSVYANVYLYSSVAYLSQRVSQLEEENYQLKQALEAATKTQTVSGEYVGSEEAPWIWIVGVYQSPSGEVGGLAMKLHVSISLGNGEIYVATKPKIGIALQEAAETARDVAFKLARVDPSKYRVDILIESASESAEVQVVDGPSAGAAIAVLTYYALTGKEISHSVVVTGQVDEEGNILKVGGLIQKAEAAAEQAGAKVFVVPKGQSVCRIPIVEEYHPAPWITMRVISGYKEVSLQQYLAEKGISIEVVEASSVSELIPLFAAS